MKTDQLKLKPLFSCGFFRQCTQTVLSPKSSTPPPLPHAPPPPQPPPQLPESSSSSSSNTSQSFTQWRFPLPNSPRPDPEPDRKADPPPTAGLEEVFRVAEAQFGSGSDVGRVGALQLLERALVANPGTDGGCPAAVVGGVVGCLRGGVGRKAASKVLLALCLAEVNRRSAVEAGAVAAVVEALADAEGAVAERSLAALELMCTTAEGATAVGSHALAVPMLVQVMGGASGRGREHAMSVLAVVYGGRGRGEAAVAPAEEVARAVALALQGECSARGRRKGAQLLRILEGNGRPEMGEDGR
ncbi:ARM repeat superfamily protein [Striga asiatica]|uniref:ARM repeat superfamily protein n=1 Tax=Striga asiatica TaxID=4170 RepID=A0A5A7PHD1_STRAF|nr:ARM repeat superfamily protein [Striga asiatica]